MEHDRFSFSLSISHSQALLLVICGICGTLHHSRFHRAPEAAPISTVTRRHDWCLVYRSHPVIREPWWELLRPQKRQTWPCLNYPSITATHTAHKATWVDNFIKSCKDSVCDDGVLTAVAPCFFFLHHHLEFNFLVLNRFGGFGLSPSIVTLALKVILFGYVSGMTITVGRAESCFVGTSGSFLFYFSCLFASREVRYLKKKNIQTFQANFPCY